MLEGKLDFADGKKYDEIKNIESYLNRLIEDETGTVLPLYEWAKQNEPTLGLE